MSSLHKLELQQKRFLLKSISNFQISFQVSYSFDIETVNTFKHSRNFLANHTRDSRPKWTKCTPVVRQKRSKNHTLWGGTYQYRLHKVVPTP